MDELNFPHDVEPEIIDYNTMAHMYSHIEACEREWARRHDDPSSYSEIRFRATIGALNARLNKARADFQIYLDWMGATPKNKIQEEICKTFEQEIIALEDEIEELLATE